MAAKGTAQRSIEWAQHNIGASVSKIAKWERQAGFSGETPWCGIFLGALMRSQGIKPPSGYPAAIEWSNFGSEVNSISEAQPGDILVYGSRHVAMYLGGHQQIQGNNHDNTVGISGVESDLTAIRRPPYRSGGSDGHSSFGPLGTAEEGVEAIGDAISGGADAVGNVADDVVSGIVGDLAKSAEALMLNVALVGGGAFLVYYGTALMLGVRRPAASLAGPLTKGATP